MRPEVACSGGQIAAGLLLNLVRNVGCDSAARRGRHASQKFEALGCLHSYKLRAESTEHSVYTLEGS